MWGRGLLITCVRASLPVRHMCSVFGLLCVSRQINKNMTDPPGGDPRGFSYQIKSRWEKNRPARGMCEIECLPDRLYAGAGRERG